MNNKQAKKFDSVQMMRDIRDKVNADIVDMDYVQIKKYVSKKTNKKKS
jgi:hypothetical protein